MLGDSLDDTNRNRVGRHRPGDPYANPQSGTPVGFDYLWTYPKLIIVLSRSVSAPVLPRSGTLDLSCVNGFKLNNLIYACNCII